LTKHGLFDFRLKLLRNKLPVSANEIDKSNNILTLHLFCVTRKSQLSNSLQCLWTDMGFNQHAHANVSPYWK